MVECCMWGLMGHLIRSLEDSNAEGNEDYSDPAQEFLERYNINISSWDTDHSCDSLAKSVSGFALVLKIFLRLT